MILDLLFADCLRDLLFMGALCLCDFGSSTWDFAGVLRDVDLSLIAALCWAICVARLIVCVSIGS